MAAEHVCGPGRDEECERSCLSERWGAATDGAVSAEHDDGLGSPFDELFGLPTTGTFDTRRHASAVRTGLSQFRYEVGVRSQRRRMIGVEDDPNGESPQRQGRSVIRFNLAVHRCARPEEFVHCRSCLRSQAKAG